jgi:hypothetical protein
MERILLGLVIGFNLAWVFMSLSRDGYWRKSSARRRGSNPPPPGRKPAPPAGPPEQPLTAQLIRYWAWQNEQVRRAWTDPSPGGQWPEDCKPDQQDVPICLVEGKVQRGGFGDGPATPKPLIKPQPTGGRQLP